MERARTVEAVRQAVARARADGHRVALVPTMGALHDGHLSLIRLAGRHAGYVVVSVFVNPTQFAPGEDYEAYPRSLDDDALRAGEAGASLLFAPAVEEVYPPGFSTRVAVDGVSAPLCGSGRPGHFDGVALVVAKLLNIVRPDVSVFGEKDAQQLALIRRMVQDLHLPGEVVAGPIVRDDDGLALSSRNRYLDPAERLAATSLSRGLLAARRLWQGGERDPDRLVSAARHDPEREESVEVEYLEIRDPDSLERWIGPDGPALLAVAARVGSARLIDNVVLGRQP